MQRFIVLFIIAAVAMFSIGVFDTTTAKELPTSNPYTEHMRPPTTRKDQAKCKRPAKEYLENGENIHERLPDSPLAVSYNTAIGIKGILSALLYDICSKLEQQNK